MRLIYPLTLVLMILAGCDRRPPSVTVTAKADGAEIKSGDVFDRPIRLTCAVIAEDESATTIEVRLDTRLIDISKDRLVAEPGVHVLEVVASDAKGNERSWSVGFSIKDREARMAEASAAVTPLDKSYQVLVEVKGLDAADPSQWTLTGIVDGVPTEDYTLPSYRLERGNGVLDDPSDAVVENGSWTLRFLIPRAEVPRAPDEFILTGILDRELIYTRIK